MARQAKCMTRSLKDKMYKSKSIKTTNRQQVGKSVYGVICYFRIFWFWGFSDDITRDYQGEN